MSLKAGDGRGEPLDRRAPDRLCRRSARAGRGGIPPAGRRRGGSGRGAQDPRAPAQPVPRLPSGERPGPDRSTASITSSAGRSLTAGLAGRGAHASLWRASTTIHALNRVTVRARYATRGLWARARVLARTPSSCLYAVSTPRRLEYSPASIPGSLVADAMFLSRGAPLAVGSAAPGPTGDDHRGVPALVAARLGYDRP